MTWYHPKYYAELRKKAREEKASSGEQQAVDLKINLKRVRKQYTSSKHQAYTSSEQQATSHKLPGPRPISNANKGLLHKRQAGKSSSNEQQASSPEQQESSDNSS